MATQHTQLVRAVLEAIYKKFERDACIQKINTAGVQAGDRYFASALPGTADIVGVIRGMGFAIECKTPNDSQRKAQKLFEAAWTRAGGCYIVGRTPEQVVADIDKAHQDVDLLIAQLRRHKT
jgi:hypothetical protein